MSNIKVVNACMGRGKTSAAISYMKSRKGEQRFLYITPLLDEVDRICDKCDFGQPDGKRKTKLSELKEMMRKGLNVASTHALFYLLDDDALDIIRKKKYSIIIDESIDTVHRENITSKDLAVLLDKFITVDEKDGKVTWNDDEYEGKFSHYKSMAQANSLYIKDDVLMYIMDPSILNVFEEVIMMTYMFEGLPQRGYLDYFGLEYQICGVDIDDSEEDNIRFSFTERPDEPPPIDYKNLISIVDDKSLNDIGDDYFSLSKGWFERRSRYDNSIKKLRNNMNTFFRRKANAKSGDILWTTFKNSSKKLIPDDGRFASSYLSLTSRATNKFKDRTVVAYIANRFVDPNVLKLFYEKGICIDTDQFALGEMLQFIWRSAIRDGKPITVYIPSKRMRDLFIKWIEERSEDKNEEN